MSDYRHNRVPGNTVFFTVRLADQGSNLLTEHIAAFGEAIRLARIKRPFHLDAWVALPDHAHLIWTMPPGDADCASRWRTVKIGFSKALRKAGTAADSGAIWAPQYLQQAITDPAQYARLVDYVHANPRRHGLCSDARHWPWSSLHRFMASGLLATPK